MGMVRQSETSVDVAAPGPARLRSLTLLWQFMLDGFCEQLIAMGTSLGRRPCEEVENGLWDGGHARLRRRERDGLQAAANSRFHMLRIAQWQGLERESASGCGAAWMDRREVDIGLGDFVHVIRPCVQGNVLNDLDHLRVVVSRELHGADIIVCHMSALPGDFHSEADGRVRDRIVRSAIAVGGDFGVVELGEIARKISVRGQAICRAARGTDDLGADRDGALACPTRGGGVFARVP